MRRKLQNYPGFPNPIQGKDEYWLKADIDRWLESEIGKQALSDNLIIEKAKKLKKRHGTDIRPDYRATSAKLDPKLIDRFLSQTSASVILSPNETMAPDIEYDTPDQLAEVKQFLDEWITSMSERCPNVNAPMAWFITRFSAVRESQLQSLIASLADPKLVLYYDAIQLFELQTNWLAVMKDSPDFRMARNDEKPDFKLPFPRSIFELEFDGKRLILDLDEQGDSFGVILFVRSPNSWININATSGDTKDHHLSNILLNLCYNQVRATCIALETEIAEQTISKAPEKLNRARAKHGKKPLPDHYFVNLHRKYRERKRAENPGTGAKRRLHFRRGHKRTYANGVELWIKWMLVGDPDLGWVSHTYET